jgi:hypothetical protein
MSINMSCDSGFSLIMYEHCYGHISSIFLIDFSGISTSRIMMWYFLLLIYNGIDN